MGHEDVLEVSVGYRVITVDFHKEAAWHATPEYLRVMGHGAYCNSYKSVMDKGLGSPARATRCILTLFSVAWDEMTDLS